MNKAKRQKKNRMLPPASAAMVIPIMTIRTATIAESTAIATGQTRAKVQIQENNIAEAAAQTTKPITPRVGKSPQGITPTIKRTSARMKKQDAVVLRKFSRSAVSSKDFKGASVMLC
jgi:hypothetical protein